MEKEIKARVDSLLRQMTLEEKAAQMIQVSFRHLGREKSLEWAKRGVGSFLFAMGADAKELQQAALNSRMGIPLLFGIDAVRGHSVNDHATVFPTQLAAASTWDREAVREMGRVTAKEVASEGLHWTFSPLLCLARDTRWGRVDETFGEDPYLTGEMAAAIIHGYQGDDLRNADSILACAKHYFAYGEAVGARDACDSEITRRKAKEVFLPPFQKAVDAGCATFMTAYGSMDGTPFTASSWALKEMLRQEMGFDGFVVTDWGNMTSLMTQQLVAETPEDAAKLAAEAGNDMMMSSEEFFDAAVSLVRSGKMAESVLDGAVGHILAVKLRMGLFENPFRQGDPHCLGCPSHLDAALNVARKSVTLIKNDGVLPLNPAQKVAVIGANGDDIRAQYGDWTYFSHPLPDPEKQPVRPYVTVKEGFAALSENTVYCRGCGPVPSAEDDLDAALTAARDADVIVHVVGDMIDQVGEAKDRANLDLSGRQSELHEKLAALGKPLVTVLLASKPLTIGREAARSNAVVIAFNGGMFGGQAVAEAVYGVFNPSGRLPISFPYHSGQVPVYYNALPGWHFGPNARYCDLPVGPLYAFGEGLSYTAFAYDGLVFDADTLQVRVTVTNTGSRAGRETVQVYFRDCVSSVLTPVKQLIAFRQVDLQPGETKTVSFQLNRMDFSLVNAQEQRVVEPGKFLLMAGHSSKDADLLKTEFTL